MATITKTLVATGASSGIGFEVIKQLMAQTQPWNFILGVRDTNKVQTEFDGLKYDTSKHNLTLLPLDLSQMKTVKTFANVALEKLGSAGKIDYLLLNAAHANSAKEKGSHHKWCDSYVVNHLSQHYLVHLLKDKLVESKSRLVFVSSGAIRGVKDTSTLDDVVKDGSGADFQPIYCATKFQQLLGAHWWRRQLTGTCHVVAVSPGLVPGTQLGRHSGMKLDPKMADAISIPQSGENILRAFTCENFPEDPEQIFLTSWGEWWPKDVYQLSLEKELQDKWCPSKEDIERDEGLAV